MVLVSGVADEVPESESFETFLYAAVFVGYAYGESIGSSPSSYQGAVLSSGASVATGIKWLF